MFRKCSWTALLFVYAAVALPITANATTWTKLHYKLSHDTAFIPGTMVTASAADTAVIEFSIRVDTAAGTIMETIDAVIVYNTDSLTYVSAAKDGANWSGTFGIDDSTTPGELVLIFELGNFSIPGDNGFDIFATIKFVPACNPDLITMGLNFSEVESENEIGLDGGFMRSPAVGNYNSGSVTIGDYITTIIISDTTVSNSANSVMLLPVHMTANYKVKEINQIIVYDTLLLTYDSVINEIWAFYDTSSSKDTIYLSFSDISANSFDDTRVYLIGFTIKCDLATDGPTNVSVVDDSTVLNTVCFIYFPADTIHNGSVSLADSAFITVDRVDTETNVVGMQTDGKKFRWSLKLLNTFAAGNPADSEHIGRLSFNVNMGAAGFGAIAGDVDSTLGLFKFSCNDDPGLININQEDSSGLDNYRGPSATATHLLAFRSRWNATGYTPTDFDDRFITPKFTHAGHTSNNTVVTDTASAACVSADSANGLLTWDDFDDTLEIVMGEFVAIGGTSTTSPCTVGSLFVRSNFDLDSFLVDIGTPANSCIYAVQSQRTGVTYSTTGDGTFSVVTTSSFVKIDSSLDLTLVATMSVGIKGGCLGGKQLGVPIWLSSPHMFSSWNAEEYSTTTNGAASAKCPNSGFGEDCGCFSCGSCGGGGAIPKDANDGTLLPTEFALRQNFPNPFNPVTKISLDMPVSSEWTITIYNVQGQKIEEFTGESSAGTVVVEWDASNYASGIYLYRARAGSFVETRKMTLLK